MELVQKIKARAEEEAEAVTSPCDSAKKTNCGTTMVCCVGGGSVDLVIRKSRSTHACLGLREVSSWMSSKNLTGNMLKHLFFLVATRSTEAKKSLCAQKHLSYRPQYKKRAFKLSDSDCDLIHSKSFYCRFFTDDILIVLPMIKASKLLENCLFLA